MTPYEQLEQKVSQLGMMLDQLSAEIEALEQDNTELRGLLKRVADNQYKAADVTLQCSLVLDEHSYHIEKLQRITEPKLVNP